MAWKKSFYIFYGRQIPHLIKLKIDLRTSNCHYTPLDPYLYIYIHIYIYTYIYIYMYKMHMHSYDYCSCINRRLIHVCNIYCISLSLHRHLREFSQGLKASHWPNAQDECVSQPALQPATSSHQPKQGAQEKLL